MNHKRTTGGNPSAPENFRETWPYFWINRVNFYYAQALEKRLKSMGLDGPRWRVLISLYQRGYYLSVSEVSDFSSMRLNTTIKIVQRMIEDELVEMRTRESDRRVREVTLTAKGETLREQALEEVYQIRDESFYNVTPAELEALNTILAKITKDLANII